MKAKKLIIGLVAVIALLITIAGAMAAVEPTATYTPLGDPAPINQTQTISFSALVANPDAMMLDYQWYVDDVLDVVSVHNDESATSYTSSFTFDAVGKSLGSHSVTVVVTGGAAPLTKTWDVIVQEATPTSLLSITSVKVNGKSTGKLSLSDLNDIKVEVSNDHTKKMKEIVVEVRILDVDGDDLEEESDEFDLSNGKEDDVTLEFDLSNEEVDEDEYTVEVEVTGEDIDGTDFSDLETLTVEVDREKDDITITKAVLEDSQVVCSAQTLQTSLDVKIKNIGENEQDNVKITVKNTELGLNLQRTAIDLDDYAGSDNDYEATFALNLEEAVTGAYTVDVAVYSEDGDLMDTKEVELQVECAANDKPSQEDQQEEQYADKELAAELQKKIDEYKAMQESQAASQGDFRQSDSYVLLLGVLVAMMFFAAVLSATYMLVKRK